MPRALLEQLHEALLELLQRRHLGELDSTTLDGHVARAHLLRALLRARTIRVRACLELRRRLGAGHILDDMELAVDASGLTAYGSHSKVRISGNLGTFGSRGQHGMQVAAVDTAFAGEGFLDFGLALEKVLGCIARGTSWAASDD